MNWYYYFRHLEGGSLSPFLPRKLAHLFCFIFGHRVPCGTGGGLCDRCYKIMVFDNDCDGWYETNNPLAITLRDFLDVLEVRAKYKFWVKL